MLVLVISCSSCLINMHYCVAFGGIFFCAKKERALEITMNPRPSPHRKNRSRLRAKLPVRIMVGIIASDNSELID
jgi:hypothetical protein